MKTYWFTVAAGEKHLEYFSDLKRSGEAIGIEIHNIADLKIKQNNTYNLHEQMMLKIKKIDGILNAPDGYDRIVFIDADTLLKDVKGIDNENGALKEPWGMGSVPLVAAKGGFIKRWRRRKRLWKKLIKSGFHDFCPGGKLHRQEWNSGVIIGNRKFLEELVIEWKKWWNIILDINDGIFRRDQMSFKYAYKKIAIDKYGFETIKPEFNWIIKKMGFNPHAKIYHRAGISKETQEQYWQDLITELAFR